MTQSHRPIPMLCKMLRAAQCRSTRHFFALDAIQHLKTVPARRLGDLLLKYHDEYLEGAQSPRSLKGMFKGIRAGEGNSDELSTKCLHWLGVARNHLNNARWKKAAYACGAMNYYFTYCLLPENHPPQNMQGEKAVGKAADSPNRPIQWSTYKTYAAISHRSQQGRSFAQFQFSPGDDWLCKAVLAIQDLSQPLCRQLVECYDLQTATRPPDFGWDDRSREILSELFALAVDGWACALTRLADEITLSLPQVPLRIPTVLTLIDMPLAWVCRKASESIRQRTAISWVRRCVRQEMVKPPAKNESPAPATAEPLVDSSNPQLPDSDLFQDGQAEPCASTLEDGKATESGPLHEPLQFLSLAEARVKYHQQQQQHHPHHPHHPLQSAQMDPAKGVSRSVHLGSPLLQSPSIGPKTARRFEKVGVTTIGQFLSSSPSELAMRLATPWLTANLINDWQDQARLICEVPGLRGYHAELLVAVGCRTAVQLRTADVAELKARLAEYCQSPEGQRILRSGQQPSLTEAASWIASAKAEARPIAA